MTTRPAAGSSAAEGGSRLRIGASPLQFRLATDGRLFTVWAVEAGELRNSEFPGHPDADYLAGFLTEAGRDAWVAEHGFEVVP